MTYGNENWDKLKLCFIKMSEQKDENIILPLASSLGEIAKILGPELTESDLLEFVDKFYKNSGEIKMKILSILPDIIRNISSNKKNQYLENIKIMIGNRDDKWRKRLNYSKIIGKYNNTYSDSIIYKRVFPIAINFCFDDVNQVRIKSAGHNSRIILQLISGDTEYKDKTLKIIQSFARSINYSYRQLFILMCKHIFEKKDVWEKDISPLLVDLAYDKIINVRISLAKFIYKVINKNKYDYLKNDNTIKKIYSILKKEDNNEISSIINLLNIETVNVDLNINVNDKFTDNMSFVSNEFGITRNVPLESKIKKNINEISPSSNLVDENDKLEEGSPIPIEEDKKEKDTNKNEENKSIEDKKE